MARPQRKPEQRRFCAAPGCRKVVLREWIKSSKQVAGLTIVTPEHMETVNGGKLVPNGRGAYEWRCADHQPDHAS